MFFPHNTSWRPFPGCPCRHPVPQSCPAIFFIPELWLSAAFEGDSPAEIVLGGRLFLFCQLSLGPVSRSGSFGERVNALPPSSVSPDAPPEKSLRSGFLPAAASASPQPRSGFGPGAGGFPCQVPLSGHDT